MAFDLCNSVCYCHIYFSLTLLFILLLLTPHALLCFYNSSNCCYPRALRCIIPVQQWEDAVEVKDD